MGKLTSDCRYPKTHGIQSHTKLSRFSHHAKRTREWRDSEIVVPKCNVERRYQFAVIKIIMHTNTYKFIAAQFISIAPSTVERPPSLSETILWHQLFVYRTATKLITFINSCWQRWLISMRAFHCPTHCKRTEFLWRIIHLTPTL